MHAGPQELDAAELVAKQAVVKPQSLTASHTPAPSESMTPRSPTDTEDDDLCRPSLYSHKPQKRFDEFDRAKMEGTGVFDALRLQSFEGCVPPSVLVPLCLSSLVHALPRAPHRVHTPACVWLPAPAALAASTTSPSSSLSSHCRTSR